MPSPVFSVVIPAYNHEKYIRRTLNSVLAQTYSDYEVIIIDDGSKDRTRQVIDSIVDPRIHYHYQKNSGRPACPRNRGIALARGKYIAFLDGDDIWYPKKLERCLEAFVSHPEAGLVCHQEIVRDSAGNEISNSCYKQLYADLYRQLLFKGNCLSPSAVAIKKDLMLAKGYRYQEDMAYFSVEDYDLWLTLAKDIRFVFLDEVLGEYIFNDDNVMSKRYEQNIRNTIFVVKQHFASYRGKKPFDALAFRSRLSKIYLSAMLALLRKNNVPGALIYGLGAIACWL